ncbi:thioesterase family protein [Atopomonas sediminilitoris]|uniref:thioesterase family protein n=1 Tax=Atopomonas sediminilitoris TaxID=2919919 RepID=UPI001F4EA05A|nr:thioesterase family protein [Atopomonas sediminilitoris]MCJ8169035.1 thioesterase family protein [Atopomonas sediminilitoris]
MDAINQGQLELDVDDSWQQGRATFGGLVAALGFQALRVRVDASKAARAAQIAFVGPVAPGKVELRPLILREGKSVVQAQCHVCQNDAVMAVVLVSFGSARESQLQVPAEPMPALKPFAAAPLMPYIENVVPRFVQHFDLAWAVGGMPFSNNASLQMGGWVRFKQAPARLDEAHVLSMVDAWPPSVLPMLKAPAAASSLTWAIEFVQPLGEVAGDAPCAYVATTERATEGYANASARLWSADGRLLALSRQCVTVFA